MALMLIAVAIAAALMAGCGGGDDSCGAADGRAGGEEIPFDTSDWRTDLNEHSVTLDEFVGGGPPKDGIPSIDEPKLVDTGEADEFLSPREPIAVVELEAEVRAYPIQILTWHEIGNDEIAGVPVAVTYCPLLRERLLRWAGNLDSARDRCHQLSSANNSANRCR